MNYCKHLKKRKNKPYCDLLKQEILLSQCKECSNKEYKIRFGSKHQNWEISNNNQINKPVKIVTKTGKKAIPMKNKSNKLAKLERNRFSIFTDDLDTCILCGRKKEELHEILNGRNRINSMKYNFVLPLCHMCHSKIQNDINFKTFWARKCQEYWESNIGTREEFIKVFGRNYLK